MPGDREEQSPWDKMAAALFDWVTTRHLNDSVADLQKAGHAVVVESFNELLFDNPHPNWRDPEVFRSLCYIAKDIMEDKGIWRE